MDANSLGIYIHELRNQCLFTEAAFNIFNQSLQQQSSTGAFVAAHTALTATAQISLILWPTRARARARGEALRKALKLDDTHPLHDKRLADIADQPDEKLDQWIQATKGEKIVIDLIGKVSALDANDVRDEALFRAYDPETKIFYYRGIGYNMQAIAKAVSGLGARIVAAHQAMFPQQTSTKPATALDNRPAEQAVRSSEPVETDADES